MFLTNVTKQFGDVISFRMGHKTLHLVNHPDYIKHVLQDNYQNYHKGIGLDQAKPLLGQGLLTSEGEHWHNQRRLVQPTFQRQRIAGFATIITDTTAATLDNWQTYLQENRTLDIVSEMTRLTLRILGRTVFALDLGGKTDEVGDALYIALEQATRRMVSFLELPISLPTPRNRRFKQALRTLDTIVYRMISERRCAAAHNNGDLLSILARARDEKTGKRISDKQLRDEIMTILLAGHETTAMALVWTWYLLARNPVVEHQLHAELAEVLGGRTPTHQDLPNLKYTRMVIQESLRLYPPVWLIPRKAIGDDEIGGYHIPAQSEVLISPYSMHRHPDYWSNPEEFKPERFGVQRSANRPRYAFLPFGGGPRSCIGSSFGMMETQLIVGMVAQRYRLRVVPSHPVQAEALLTLRPRHVVLMKIQERKA